MIPAIEIHNLHKIYAGGVEALKGIDLTVPAGEFFGLLGPNGAGKTTTIGITTGLLRITDGSVKVMGCDVVRQFRQARRHIGLAAQELSFDWFFAIEDLMMLQAGYYGIGRKVARLNTDRLLDTFGLSGKKRAKPRELSGGMKRRFQIARSLVHDPDILILDEPTAGVDVELRHRLWEYLTRLNKEGKTVILTTHYIEEAEQMADRIGVISKGEIILVDRKDELMRKLGSKQLILELHNRLEQIPEGLSRYDLRLDEHGTQLVYFYDTHGERTGITSLLNDLNEAGVKFRDLKTTQSSLEDIFVDLVRKSA